MPTPPRGVVAADEEDDAVDGVLVLFPDEADEDEDAPTPLEPAAEDEATALAAPAEGDVRDEPPLDAVPPLPVAPAPPAPSARAGPDSGASPAPGLGTVGTYMNPSSEPWPASEAEPEDEDRDMPLVVVVRRGRDGWEVPEPEEVPAAALLCVPGTVPVTRPPLLTLAMGAVRVAALAFSSAPTRASLCMRPNWKTGAVGDAAEGEALALADAADADEGATVAADVLVAAMGPDGDDAGVLIAAPVEPDGADVDEEMVTPLSVLCTIRVDTATSNKVVGLIK